MWTIIKFALYIGVFSYLALFALDNIPSLKAQVIEFTNPSIKEARLIQNLKEIQSDIKKELEDSAQSTPEKIAKLKSANTEAEKILAEIETTNDRESSLPSMAIKAISEKIFDNGSNSTITSRLLDTFNFSQNKDNLASPSLSSLPPTPPIPLPCK